MAKIEKTFIRTLIFDVLAAHESLSENDDQARRRNFIRTAFAAIEGLSWSLRDHVLSVGMHLDFLSPMHAMAFRDVGYAVNERGILRATPQYMPLQTAIRYSVRCAQVIAPELSIDYKETGWMHLRTAIDVRHRITHPKTESALTVKDTDLKVTFSALLWLLATTEEVMQITMNTQREYNVAARDMLAALKRGDPETLRLYNEAWLRGDGR